MHQLRSREHPSSQGTAIHKAQNATEVAVNAGKPRFLNLQKPQNPKIKKNLFNFFVQIVSLHSEVTFGGTFLHQLDAALHLFRGALLHDVA